MVQPDNAGPEFYNYTGTHSIVLMGIYNASYKFIVADVGQKWSGNDAGIWEFSQFCMGLKERRINLPEPCILPNDTSGKLFF